MARKNDCFWIEGKNFFSNAVEKQWPIPAGQIPTSNAFAEQNIASDELTELREIKTQTPWAMTRHIECAELHSLQLDIALIDQQIGLEWLHIDIKAMPFEKCGVRNHGNGFRVKSNFTSMPPLDFCSIYDVVKVTVGKNDPVDLGFCKMLIGPVWSIKENIPLGCRQNLRVREKLAAGKSFERIHEVQDRR